MIKIYRILFLFIFCSNTSDLFSQDKHTQINWIREQNLNGNFPVFLGGNEKKAYFLKVNMQNSNYYFNELNEYLLEIIDLEKGDFKSISFADETKDLSKLKNQFLNSFNIDSIRNEIHFITTKKEFSEKNEFYLHAFDIETNNFKYSKLIATEFSNFNLTDIDSSFFNKSSKYLAIGIKPKSDSKLIFTTFNSDFEPLNQYFLRLPYQNGLFNIFGYRILKNAKVLVYGSYFNSKLDYKNNNKIIQILTYDLIGNKIEKIVDVPLNDSMKIQSTFVVKNNIKNTFDFTMTYTFVNQNSKSDQNITGIDGLLMLKYDIEKGTLLNHKNIPFSKSTTPELIPYVVKNSFKFHLSNRNVLFGFQNRIYFNTNILSLLRIQPPKSPISFDENNNISSNLWDVNGFINFFITKDSLKLFKIDLIGMNQKPFNFTKKNPKKSNSIYLQTSQALSFGFENFTFKGVDYTITSDNINNIYESGSNFNQERIEYSFKDSEDGAAILMYYDKENNHQRKLLFDYKKSGFRLLTKLCCRVSKTKYFIAVIDESNKTPTLKTGLINIDKMLE